MNHAKFVLIFLLGVLLCPQLCFGEQAEKDELKVFGMGVLVSSNPYEGDDASVWPVPIVAWRNEHFFVKGIEAGWVAYETDDLRADVFFRPRLMGYQADDASVLSGMEDRNFSLDGGVRLAWTLPNTESTEISVSAVSDLLNEYQGQEMAVALSRTFKSDIYQVQPSVGMKWQSENLVKYYYGVRANEVTASRPGYDGGAAWNPYVQVNFYLGLPKELLLVTQFRAEFLSNEITDSPLVNKDQVLAGVIGIAKRY